MGVGAQSRSGLAACDKNPREEFTAPFNTVIIFLLSAGGAAPAQNASIPPFRRTPSALQVYKTTSQANPKPERAQEKEVWSHKANFIARDQEAEKRPGFLNPSLEPNRRITSLSNSVGQQKSKLQTKPILGQAL